MPDGPSSAYEALDLLAQASRRTADDKESAFRLAESSSFAPHGRESVDLKGGLRLTERTLWPELGLCLLRGVFDSWGWTMTRLD